MLIHNTSTYGANGGNRTMKTQLKKGRTFYFGTLTEAQRFCKQHDISEDVLECQGKTWKYTHE